MKSLKESLLSDMDDVLKSGDKTIKDSIKKWLKENLDKGISKCKISRKANNKGLFEVSASGDIEISYKAQSLTNEYFEWSNIDGSFFCTYNNYITTLKGAPKYVSQTFSIKGCKNLETLEGAPETVEEGSFICSCCNSLKSLEGAPKKVGGIFSCNSCKGLTSLKGAPKEFSEEFYCPYCDSLQTLEGAPKKVGGIFSCSSCKGLTSLKGAPKEVSEEFYCSYCDSLQTLEGAPKKVGCDFSCIGCKSLQTLEGAPKTVKKHFYCSDCGRQFTEDEVKSVCDVKGNIII